jgi:hypothetical protein
MQQFTRRIARNNGIKFTRGREVDRGYDLTNQGIIQILRRISAFSFFGGRARRRTHAERKNFDRSNCSPARAAAVEAFYGSLISE